MNWIQWYPAIIAIVLGHVVCGHILWQVRGGEPHEKAVPLFVLGLVWLFALITLSGQASEDPEMCPEWIRWVCEIL
jgi:hypothetical protein